MARYIIKKMEYGTGFHVNEEIDSIKVRRIFCSLDHKCINYKGETGWCIKDKIYSKARPDDSIYIASVDNESQINYKALQLLYGK